MKCNNQYSNKLFAICFRVMFLFIVLIAICRVSAGCNASKHKSINKTINSEVDNAFNPKNMGDALSSCEDVESFIQIKKIYNESKNKVKMAFSFYERDTGTTYCTLIFMKEDKGKCLINYVNTRYDETSKMLIIDEKICGEIVKTIKQLNGLQQIKLKLREGTCESCSCFNLKTRDRP